MATGGESNGGDPFPLFHLCDLDFAISAELIPRLPAYQLALAPWSTAWSEDLEPALKRTWRRKRERARTQITQKAPCGVYASEEEKSKEQYPKFELIPLDFDLTGGEAALEGLTSAQLAAIQFHPSGSKDLAFAAEDIFFSRRERDFAAGLSLPSFAPATSATPAPPPPPAASTAAAPIVQNVAPAAPAPPAAPVPTPAPVPVGAQQPPSENAAPVPTPPQPVVVSAPYIAPPPVAATPIAAVIPAAASVASGTAAVPAPPPAVASSSVAPPPAPVVQQEQQQQSILAAPAAAIQPTPPSPGTKQREFERAEYRRNVNGTTGGGASDPFTSVPPQQPRGRSRSTSRDRARESGTGGGEKDKERQRERDRDRERERERERERDRDRERERGSRSRRSSRERERERDRDREGRSTRDKERTRRSSMSRDRDRERDRDRDRIRERSPIRRSLHRDRSRSRSRSRSLDRSGLSRRLAEEKRRLSLSMGSAATGAISGHNGDLSSSLLRKRASSPATSEAASLRSSIRRRIDEPHDYDRPMGGAAARRTPPPQMPLPSEEIPRDLSATLKTVFLRHFPGQLNPGDIEAWLRTLAPAQSAIPITPVGIRATHRRNTDKSPNQDMWVTLAFVAFRSEAEAAEVQARADKQHVGSRSIVSSWSHETGKKNAWKWSDFTPEFVEEEYRRSLDVYHGRGGAAPPRLSSIPPPLAPHAYQRAHLPNVPPAAAPSSTSANVAELPTHLVSRLAVLYVTNLPGSTTLEECRNFFDICDNLVGLALELPQNAHDYANVWLAFETEPARERAKHSIYGVKYPGTLKKLWVEKAEERARKTGECHIWLWSNMSKAYKQQNAADYERIRAMLPGSPTMTRSVMGLPSAPRAAFAPSYAAHAVQQQPPSPASAAFVPSAAYTSTHGNGTYEASSHAPPMNGGYTPDAPRFMPAVTGLDQAYSPMQPLLASFPTPPRPPASFVDAQPHYNAPISIAPSPQPPQTRGFVPSSLAGGHINPARLAMLQASLSAAGYSPGTPDLGADTRPDAATEKLQVDEATRGAWASARKSSLPIGGVGEISPAGSASNTQISVKGTANQAGQGSPLLASQAPSVNTSIAPLSQTATLERAAEPEQSAERGVSSNENVTAPSAPVSAEDQNGTRQADAEAILSATSEVSQAQE
ncbi:hypothetical protein JCM10908_002482 [Rhodotorula pacifica]|uniref:uncharacterized protein n=1 Tax=Rhodotorula pacifica TaxID=1495444 RepID=UPI0031791C8B